MAKRAAGCEKAIGDTGRKDVDEIEAAKGASEVTADMV